MLLGYQRRIIAVLKAIPMPNVDLNVWSLSSVDGTKGMLSILSVILSSNMAMDIAIL